MKVTLQDYKDTLSALGENISKIEKEAEDTFHQIRKDFVIPLVILAEQIESELEKQKIGIDPETKKERSRIFNTTEISTIKAPPTPAKKPSKLTLHLETDISESSSTDPDVVYSPADLYLAVKRDTLPPKDAGERLAGILNQTLQEGSSREALDEKEKNTIEGKTVKGEKYTFTAGEMKRRQKTIQAAFGDQLSSPRSSSSTDTSPPSSPSSSQTEEGPTTQIPSRPRRPAPPTPVTAQPTAEDQPAPPPASQVEHCCCCRVFPCCIGLCHES